MDLTNPFTALRMSDFVPARSSVSRSSFTRVPSKPPSDAQVAKWVAEKAAETRARIECTSKRQFSKREAMTVVNGRSCRRNKTRYRMRCYQCPQCNMWHLATDDGNDE